MTTIARIARWLWVFVAMVFLLSIITAVSYRTGKAEGIVATALKTKKSLSKEFTFTLS